MKYILPVNSRDALVAIYRELVLQAHPEAQFEGPEEDTESSAVPLKLRDGAESS